jgi:hypothetical protein
MCCVAGGDWNATVSTVNSQDNIDIIGMASPPSIFRSSSISNLCTLHKLLDSYRAMWPEGRDFTYIPKTGRNNRSRIDFIIISDSLLEYCTKASISPSLNSTLFDHKSVHVSIGINEGGVNNTIFNSTLQHPCFMDVVTTSIVESFVNHAALNTPNIDRIRANIGNAISLTRNLNNLSLEISLEGANPERLTRMEQLGAGLADAIRTLLNTEVLNSFTLVPDPDTFFEVLCMNLNNDLGSFQGWLKKSESCRLNKLKKVLNQLRLNYVENQEQIFELERATANILDVKINSKVSNLKIFENLNSERATPVFLALAKNNNTDKLSEVKQEDGTDFPDDNTRN